MRLLWISGICPVPPTDGNRLRTYHLLRAAARHHEVTLLCSARPREVDSLDQLREICSKVVAVTAGHDYGDNSVVRVRRRLEGTLFRRPNCFLPRNLTALRGELNRLGEPRFDLAFGSLYCAQLVFGAPARSCVLDCQNVEAELYRGLWITEPFGPRRLSRYLDWTAVDAFEQKSLPRADLVTVCSERDRQMLSDRIRSLPPIVLVPNGVDVSQSSDSVEKRDRNRLMFVGGMSYAPNVEAAVELARRVMPLIWQSRPETRLWIVGKNPAPAVRALASDRVEVTGEVEDVSTYLAQAAALVAPLRTGGGTRLKILEAMAAGLPVVSTTLGADGLDLVSGVEVAIADTPDALAGAAIALMERPEQATAQAAAARARVEADFDWDKIGRRFSTMLSACAAGKRGAAIVAG